MAFTYKIWVSPSAYEIMYQEMRNQGHSSVKETIKELLLTADEDAIARALVLAAHREAQRAR